MTIRASFLNKSLFAPRFFLNTLKKSWTNFLLYFIVLFFSFPVPIMISTQSSYYSESPTVTFEYLVERVLNMLEDLNYISIFLAAAIAVFAGCAATRYLNSKTSTYFYHSLPVTREALYFTRVLTGVINYVSALIFSTLIGALVLLARIGAAPEIAFSFLSMLGYSLLVFFTIFFITVFVGMFCGTTPVQFVMTCVLLFIVPATLSVVLLLMDEYMAYVDVSWYFENIVIYSSPALRIFTLFDSPLSVIDVVLFALTALLSAFFALRIYLLRGNENAENPIVFSSVASFWKYAIMIPTTVAMGVWFGEMGGGLWQIFGFAAGAVLTFMLINAVFTKNARAIFKGARGLVVFCIVFALCFVMTAFDMLGFDEYIPGDNLVSRVEVSINGQDYGSYRDKGVWKALKNDLKRYVKERGDHSIEYPYDGIGYVVAEVDEVYAEKYEIGKNVICPTDVRVNVVYFTKLGMPIAKSYYGVPKDDFRDSLTAIADSDEFEKIYSEYLGFFDDSNYYDITLPGLDKFRLQSKQYNGDGDLVDILDQKYIEDMGDISYERFQYPEVGYMYKRIRLKNDSGYMRFEFPLLANCDNFFEVFLEGENIYDVYLENIHSVNVYLVQNDKDGVSELKKMTLTERDDIRKVLSSTACLSDYHAYNVFCEYDYRYLVEIRYHHDATYVKEDGKYIFNEDYIGDVSYFIKDKVPTFVENELK